MAQKDEKRKVSGEAREKIRLAGFKSWIGKAILTHGENFDYSQSKEHFATQKSPEVPIKCKEHQQVFNVTPYNHIRFKSGGCRECDKEQANKYFIERERKKFYKFFEKNLSHRLSIASEFCGMTEDMDFYCKIHDSSSKHKPTQLMNNSGYGCSACSNEAKKSLNRLQLAEVISELREDFPDNVHIVNVEFDDVTSSSKVRVRCDIHGESLTSKGYLKNSRYKCPKCGDESVGYAGHRLKALIDANHRGRPTQIGVMEIEVFGITSLKVGVTTRTLKDRYKWHLKKIIFSTQVDEIDAYVLENKIHRAFRESHDLRILMAGMRNGERWSGDTECYWIEKLDEIIKFIKEYIDSAEAVAYESELALYEVPNFFVRDVTREKDLSNLPIAVVGVHPKTLEVIVEFESISDALNAGYRNVSSVISENSDRQIAGGLRWFKKAAFDRTKIPILESSKRGNPRAVVCVDSGELFESIKIAERAMQERGIKISGSHITSVCKGKRRVAGGFRWAYKDK
jgi:hypothetical protein